MIAGNLWQLLTGIVALFKLLRLGARLLMRYAPLLFIELRKVGARAIAAAAQMAEILTKIGRQVVDGLTRIGGGRLSAHVAGADVGFHIGAAWRHRRHISLHGLVRIILDRLAGLRVEPFGPCDFLDERGAQTNLPVVRSIA